VIKRNGEDTKSGHPRLYSFEKHDVIAVVPMWGPVLVIGIITCRWVTFKVKKGRPDDGEEDFMAACPLKTSTPLRLDRA